MEKLRILVDMDDVMEDLRSEWIGTINREYNINIKDEEITTWDICSHIQEHAQIPRDKIFSIIEDEHFWERVKPIDGASEYLAKLQNEGHEIYVVTATSPMTYEAKYKWIIQRYFPFISQKDIITTWHKDLIVGDVLIDDAPHNLIGADIPSLKLMMDAPYNQDVDLKANNIIRVNNWEEIYGYISSK